MPEITETVEKKTAGELDLSALEELDYGFTQKCDNEECDRDATHQIRCHCKVGSEFSCLPCIQAMKSEVPLGGGFIFFDPSKSCGHLSLISLCEIAPL